LRIMPSADPSGYQPVWTGCDSVDGRVCVVTLTGDRTVFVSPTAL
jgi:hypothetical protein